MLNPFADGGLALLPGCRLVSFQFFAVSFIFYSTLSAFRFVFFFCLSPAGSHAKIYIDGHQERDASASFDTLRPKRLDKQQFLSVFITLCVWVCNGVCGCVCMPFNSSYNCEAKSLASQLEALIKGRALI